jgi:hypothetical protein
MLERFVGGLKEFPLKSMRVKHGDLHGLPPIEKIDSHRFTFFSLSAFPTTDTELKLIAAAAMIGLNRRPNAG